jgi:hypothetical protein
MLITQYETLRGAVLGDALPPEARAGLLLFLRRGLCGWARAVATIGKPPQPTGSRPTNWKMPEEIRALVHIFAAMAINASPYGAAL